MVGISSRDRVTDIHSWNRLSYPQRLFLWLLAYSLLLIGSFVLFQYHREKEFKTDKVNSQLQLINTYILTELSKGIKPEEIKLDEFHPFDDLRLSVVTLRGDVIYDNTLDSLPHTNHLDREEIKKAISNVSGYAVRRHSESTGETYFYAALIGSDGYIVRTAVPYSMSLSSFLEADYSFLWISAIISLVMCTLGYFSTRRVGLHILRLNRFAENVEHGAIISDTEPFPHDELGEISNHIVRLYARLQQAILDRDNEHRAAMYEQQEKERIKKQLTNNINHELKTPISAIQVCIETLLSHGDMTDEKREQFLQRCLANTHRLSRLLGDVSLITRMDDGSVSIMKEDVDLAEIIESVVADYEPLAESKGIYVKNDISLRLFMFGNRSLLESVFSNIIDNAISYSGCSIISLRLLSKNSDKITLSVSDNGVGIPEIHLPRIFERFYRIDKGRSRAAGGTGLGLSIVKNAVMIHGGIISIENLASGGLEFKISFSVHA